MNHAANLVNDHKWMLGTLSVKDVQITAANFAVSLRSDNIRVPLQQLVPSGLPVKNHPLINSPVHQLLYYV
ncbi:MAG: hypothetical protein AAF633_04630 [Chloroflexota bacterium]